MTIKSIAHRGASGYCSENTLDAVEQAITLGADIIEIDIRALKTGELVLYHDAKMTRLHHKDEDIENISLEELMTINHTLCSEKKEIPFLEDIIKKVNRRCILNLEIKSKNIVDSVFGLLKNMVKVGWTWNDFIISCFDKKTLQGFRRLTPNIKLAVLEEHNPSLAIAWAHKVEAKAINIYYKITDKAFVQKCHNQGLEVNVWTINENEEIRHAKSMKVDGIITNFPDRIKK